MATPSLYSEPHQAHVFLGKLPAAEAPSHIPALKDLLKAVPAAQAAIPPIPAHFGHGYDFGRSGWLMLGNGPDDTVFPGFQGCGDCAWAGPAHEVMESNKNAGRPIPRFSGQTVVRQYSAYSGYDPQTGANDNGSVLVDVIQHRQTTGLRDDAGHHHKLGPMVKLTPGDIHEYWAACYLFENVGMGLQIARAQMDQLNAGQPWDYVPRSPIEGGHYTPGMGDNGLITWGLRQGFTIPFYEHQNDEAYAGIDIERYNAVTGKTLEGFQDADLELYLHDFTALN